MLWRACRGNVFLRQAEIEDPLEDPLLGGSVRKSVFLLFFQVRGALIYTVSMHTLSVSQNHPQPSWDSIT
jgi:hypothetical protein